MKDSIDLLLYKGYHKNKFGGYSKRGVEVIFVGKEEVTVYPYLSTSYHKRVKEKELNETLDKVEKDL